MSSMMTPKFRKDTKIIYTDGQNKEYRGLVVRVHRPEGTDFFVYTVELFAEKVETGDPSDPIDWKTVALEVQNVSDYSLSFHE